MTRPIYDDEQAVVTVGEMTPLRARVHCIISLALRYGAPSLYFGLILTSMETESVSRFFSSVPVSFVLYHLLLIAPYFASWALMIKVRINKKNSIFGLILMIHYILETVVVLLYLYISLTSFIHAIAN